MQIFRHKFCHLLLGWGGGGAFGDNGLGGSNKGKHSVI